MFNYDEEVDTSAEKERLQSLYLEVIVKALSTYNSGNLMQLSLVKKYDSNGYMGYMLGYTESIGYTLGPIWETTKSPTTHGWITPVTDVVTEDSVTDRINTLREANDIKPLAVSSDN